MNIPINRNLRLTSDRYQWIVERRSGAIWEQIRFVHALPNVAPILLRDKLCAERDLQGVREVARHIAAHLRDVGAPLADEVYRSNPPRLPNKQQRWLPIGDGRHWGVSWMPAGKTHSSYQFGLPSQQKELWGCWSTLRLTLKECLLLRIRMGADPSFWPPWAAELAAAAEVGATGRA